MSASERPRKTYLAILLRVLDQHRRAALRERIDVLRVLQQRGVADGAGDELLVRRLCESASSGGNGRTRSKIGLAP